jgi:hypothetical protein
MKVIPGTFLKPAAGFRDFRYSRCAVIVVKAKLVITTKSVFHFFGVTVKMNRIRTSVVNRIARRLKKTIT